MINSMGGTEILYNRLNSLVDLSHINLIKSICDFSLLSNTKPNILWEHLSYDQNGVKQLNNSDFVKALDAIVFVSHWQHEQFRRRFPIDGNKCFVIQNATDPIPVHEKPKDKIRIIYTSTPWRGLQVLLEAYKRLNRNDVELVVYSGTTIYGKDFAEQTKGQYDALYAEMKRLGVTHIEYAPNSEVREALKSAHILAYPSIWEETSCLSAIEALSAGCKVVTTNFGALYETCGIWADMIPVGENMIERYTQLLNHTIDTYWNHEVQSKLKDQVMCYNKYWTWETRQQEWVQFLNGHNKLLQQVEAA